MTPTEQLPELTKEELEQIEIDADLYNVVTFSCSREDYKNILIRERRRAKAERDFLKFQIADLKERHGDKAPF